MSLTAEQQAIRVTRIGSSDIGALLGVDNRTPLDVFKQKALGIPMDVSDEMAWGHFVEDAAFKYLAEHKGIRATHPGTLVHPKYDFICATPDGIEVDGERRVLEVKNVGLWMVNTWGDAGASEVPMRYRAQVLWELGCSMAHGLSGSVGQAVPILASAPPNEWQYRVEFSESTFGVLVEVAERFVRNCLLPKKPPEGWEEDRRALDYVKARFREHDKNLRQRTPDVEKVARQLVHAKSRIVKWEKARDTAQARLCDAIGDAEGIEGLATWRANKKGIRTLRLLGENDR